MRKVKMVCPTCKKEEWVKVLDGIPAIFCNTCIVVENVMVKMEAADAGPETRE